MVDYWLAVVISTAGFIFGTRVLVREKDTYRRALKIIYVASMGVVFLWYASVALHMLDPLTSPFRNWARVAIILIVLMGVFRDQNEARRQKQKDNEPSHN